MIGSTIAKLRKQKKLTQAKFAEALHVTQAAVSQWETGRTKPDYQQLFILADFFGVTVEALSTGDMSAGVASENAPALDTRAEAKQLLEGLSDDQYQAALQYLQFLKTQKG
jgi:transcriptional regulator with XRE-family HTH domain